MKKHKHQFRHGRLSKEEKAKGCISAVSCKKCKFRLTINNKISKKDMAWAEKVAKRFKEFKF